MEPKGKEQKRRLLILSPKTHVTFLSLALDLDVGLANTIKNDTGFYLT